MTATEQAGAGRVWGPRFWLLNGAAWCLFAVTNTSAIYADLWRAGRQGSWGQILTQYLVFYLPWLFVTPLVFWWVARYPLARGGWHRQGAKYLLFMAGWLAVYMPTEAALYSLVIHGTLRSFGEAFAGIPLNAWVLDSVLLIALFGVASARDRSRAVRQQEREASQLAVQHAELSARFADARLHMLQAQLEPHFLFNALNAVTALIRCHEPETAVRAVGLLSELLRYATHASTRDRVTVAEEIDFAEAYLGFQQLRYGDRLSCAIDLDDAVGGLEIPPLIVQPLLENAIRHGVEQIDRPSKVWLSAAFDQQALIVTVRNAPGSLAALTSGLGVGLANTRERLALIYRQPIDVRLSESGGGVDAELIVPQEIPLCSSTPHWATLP